MRAKRQFPVAQVNELAVGLLFADQLIIHVDVTCRRLLQIIYTTQERGFARSAGSDDRELLTLLHIDAYAGQHIESAKGFV